MSFSRNQLFLLIGALALVVFFAAKGWKSSKGSVNESVNTSSGFEIESYIAAEKKELSPELQTRVDILEKDAKRKEGLQELIVLWDSLNNQMISAHYMEQYASMEPTEKNWFAAGSKYYQVAGLSNDSNMMTVAAAKAKSSFEEVMKINPENLDAKTANAAIVVQIDQDVMKGVGMLKEVVSKDSNHVQAIFTLGMLSIQSGQFDKAQERFKKLITLQPFNPEYYFYLGEAQAKSGNAKDAIKTYETCKTLLKDEAARKEIETLIQKLKNI